MLGLKRARRIARVNRPETGDDADYDFMYSFVTVGAAHTLTCVDISQDVPELIRCVPPRLQQLSRQYPILEANYLLTRHRCYR